MFCVKDLMQLEGQDEVKFLFSEEIKAVSVVCTARCTCKEDKKVISSLLNNFTEFLCDFLDFS